MTQLVVLVPSKGRPVAGQDILDAFNATTSGDSELVFVLDAEDPDAGDYPTEAAQYSSTGTTLVERLNEAASAFARGDLGDPPAAIAVLFDRHRPRSSGWDQALLDALGTLGTGIVYGDDLVQHDALPTACAMTSDLVTTMRYIAPFGLTHSFLDRFWLDIGSEIDRIQYVPGVVIEDTDPPSGEDDADATAYAEFKGGSGWAKAVARAGGLL